MHDPWQLQDDSKIRVESALNYEQQDKTTRKWPAYQTAHSCTQTKNNEKLITRPIASVAYTYNPHYNVTYCSPCKSKPLFSWMYLQFPFFGMQYPSSETSNHASGDIMDNDIWAFGRKCESCSPQFSPFHAYSRVSHKHSHHFKKYFTFKNKWSNRYVKSLKSDANYKFGCQQIKLWFQIPKINKCFFKSYFFWMISYQFIKILSGLKRLIDFWLT